MKKMASVSLFLCSLIPKKNDLDSAEIDGDDNGLTMLNHSFGTKLVGRNHLCSVGDFFVANIRVSRAAILNT